MTAGVFSVSVEPPENPLNMRIRAVHPDAPVPKEQLGLKTAVYNALFVLRQLEDPKHSMAVYAKHLKSIAELGLCGDEAQTEDAEEELRQFKAKVVAHAGQVIKNHYAQRLGWLAFVNAAAAAGIYAAIKGVPLLLDLLTRLGMNALDLIWLRSHMFAWCGAMAGTWVCFVLRNENVAFADLGRINPGWRAAQLRLLITGIQTLFIGLLMHKEVLSFQIGKFDTRLFPEDAVVALLVGVLCGYSEKTLSLVINSKAAALLNGKGREAADVDREERTGPLSWLGLGRKKPGKPPKGENPPGPKQGDPQQAPK